MRNFVKFLLFAGLRRGARVVELDSLENCCALTGTVGSNPTLSAIQILDFGFRIEKTEV